METKITAINFVNKIKSTEDNLQKQENTGNIITFNPGVKPKSKDDKFTSNTIVKTKEELTPNSLTFNKSTSYVKENMQKSIDELKEMISNNRTGGNGTVSSNPVSTGFMYVLSDALSAVEKTNEFTPEKLKAVNDAFMKVVGGEPLSYQELKILNDFSDFMINKAEGLGLAKEKFENLSQVLKGALESRRTLEERKSDFFNAALQTDRKMSVLLEVVSDPAFNIDSNVVEMINTVKTKYANIRNSGDIISTVIFSAYMDKILQTMQDIKSGKQRDHNVFTGLKTEYQVFIDTTLTTLGNKQVPARAHLEAYLGPESGDTVFNVLTAETSEPLITEGLSSGSPDGTVKPRMNFFDRLNLLRLTSEEEHSLSNVSLSAVSEAMNCQNFSVAVSEVRQSVKVLAFKAAGYSEAFAASVKGVIGLIIYVSSDEFKESWNKMLIDNAILGNTLRLEVKNLIAIADKMEAEINLNMEESKDNVASLLQRFREIISALDLESRRFNKKQEDIEMIDIKHLKQVKENNDYQGYLNKNREQFLENINQQKRADERKFSFDLGLKKN